MIKNIYSKFIFFFVYNKYYRRKILNLFLGLFGLKLSRKAVSVNQYGFSHGADYSLVMIGAHNGKKTTQLVNDALKFGKVCLVEPVPHLFNQLLDRYKGGDGICLINKCITPTETAFVDFYSISQASNKVTIYGDQLGSLNSQHAKNHDIRFEEFVKKIRVPALTVAKLLTEQNCSKIDCLYLDTEGSDVQILLSFPFNVVKPKTIIFEHLHTDGTGITGNNFLSIIKFLKSEGYKISRFDSENALATLC